MSFEKTSGKEAIYEAPDAISIGGNNEIKVWQKPALISDSTTAEPAVNGDAQDAA